MVVLPRGGPHAEQQAWAKILRELGTGPTRAELVSRFPGSKDETNCMGFVSRSREWGLLEPRLVNGRYLLTTDARSLSRKGYMTRSTQ